MKKFAFRYLGALLAVFGGFIIINPRYYHNIHDIVYDFSAYNIPFGIFLIILGLCFFVSSLRKKQEDNDDRKESFVICPKCRTPYYAKDIQGGLCPRCGVRVENLDGFYERHPELRDKSESDNP